MPAWPAGQLTAVAHRLASRLNRVDDAAVSGAAATVSVQRLSDRFAVVALPLLDEMRGSDDDARDAEPTLNAAFENKCFADDSPGFFGKVVHRPDIVPRHLLRLPQARQRGLAVNHHEAAAAGAFGRTPVLARRNAAFLSEHFQQVHSYFVVGFGCLAVQLEGEMGHLDYIDCRLGRGGCETTDYAE